MQLPPIPRLLSFVALILVGCGSQAPETVRTYDEPLTAVDTLGAQDEPVVARPRKLSLQGNELLVSDPSEGQVHRFDVLTGAHTGTIGARGAGPGEFQDITDYVQVQDTLLVSDWRAQRMESFVHGQYRQSYRVVGRQYVHNLGRVGSMVISAMIPLASEKNSDKLFHVLSLSGDSASFPVAFGDADSLLGFSDPFILQIASGMPGHMVETGPEEFLFVPSFFNGIIHRVGKQGSHWHVESHDVGNPGSAGPAVEIVDEGPLEEGYVTYRVNDRGLVVRRESRGAWILESGLLANFLIYPDNGRYVFAAQLINPQSMEVVEVRVLDRFDGTPPKNVPGYPVFPGAMGEGDRLYSVNYDMESREPYIVVSAF